MVSLSSSDPGLEGTLIPVLLVTSEDIITRILAISTPILC